MHSEPMTFRRAPMCRFIFVLTAVMLVVPWPSSSLVPPGYACSSAPGCWSPSSMRGYGRGSGQRRLSCIHTCWRSPGRSSGARSAAVKSRPCASSPGKSCDRRSVGGCGSGQAGSGAVLAGSGQRAEESSRCTFRVSIDSFGSSAPTSGLGSFPLINLKRLSALSPRDDPYGLPKVSHHVSRCGRARLGVLFRGT